MYLFDTNALSELAVRRPNPLVYDRFFQTAPHLRFSSFVVLQELRYGASLHPQPDVVWQKVEREILPFVRWLEFEEAAALRAGHLQAELHRAGQLVDVEDIQIAATALSQDFTLVSRNTRHFERMPGLKLENWFE